MPSSYPAGTDAPLSLGLTDTSPVPVSVQVSVRDEVGNLLNTFQTPGAATSFSIPALDNILEDGALVGAREATIVATFPDATTYTEVQRYLLRNPTRLVVLQNSFMTSTEALMVRASLPRLAAFDSASEDDQVMALGVAYTAMTHLRFKYNVGIYNQSRIADFVGVSDDGYGRLSVTVTSIADVLPYEWADFPSDFKTALQRAQMVQANVILDGDPIGQKRRDGISSETIGESSMTFRAIPELRQAISKDAMVYLRGFVTSGTRIGRGS